MPHESAQHPLKYSYTFHVVRRKPKGKSPAVNTSWAENIEELGSFGTVRKHQAYIHASLKCLGVHTTLARAPFSELHSIRGFKSASTPHRTPLLPQFGSSLRLRSTDYLFFSLTIQVEQFWAFYNHMVRPSEFPNTDYHLFRQGTIFSFFKVHSMKRSTESLR